MMDKRLKLIEKLRNRYPSLEKDELMADLESEIVNMEGGEDMGMEMEEEMPMDEELDMEDEMEEEDDFLTEEDEEGDALMLAIGKKKPKKKMY